MPTISIDARMINDSGIGRYIEEIISHLVKEEDFKVYCLCNDRLDNFEWSKKVEFVHVRSRILSISEQLELPLKIPQTDIFWSPQYNVPLLPIRAKKRIVTIPDVYHLAHIDELSLWKILYVKIVTKAAIYLSSSVITISEFSKNEILKYTNIKINKIKMIYCAVDENFSDNVSGIAIECKYILFVGNVKPHKNLENALKAYKIFSDKYTNYKFIIVGKKEGFITGYNNIGELIKGIEHKVVFTGHVTDNILKQYYAGANIFFFPSRYEGFGLPLLEAMKFNIPILSSYAASLKEVGGEAILYCNPNDVNDMAQKLGEVIANRNFFSHEKYAAQLSKFSWHKAALDYIKVFRDISA